MLPIHFGLGTPEHEAGNRRAYQAGLDASATEKMAEAIPVWCPEWPEPEKRAGDAGGSKFSGLSLD